MKHSIIISSFAVTIFSTLFFISCSSEFATEESTETQKGLAEMTFSANSGAGNNIDSRTTLGSDLRILWSEGDIIGIFDSKGNNNPFNISDGVGTTIAQFEGQAAPSEKYYAVYPYFGASKINNNIIEGISVPKTQIPESNGFHKRANYMVAISSDENNFQFRNVCTYAKITTKESYEHIDITAGDNDALSGYFDVEIGEDGNIVDTRSSMYYNTVSIAQSKAKDPGTYYVAFVPGTLEELFVVCRDANGNGLYRKITNTIHAFEEGGTVVDFGIVSEENGWKKLGLCPDGNHPHMIDLGLPSGTLWSCMNVGASEPVDKGNYYAWGETEPQALDNYDISHYKWAEGTETSMKKYCVDSTFGFADGITTLALEDDAARVNWLSPWRMPTREELNELQDNCKILMNKRNGIQGFDVISRINGNIIFLPYSGAIDQGQIKKSTSCGLWSSTLCTEQSNLAFDIAFHANRTKAAESRDARWNGMPVRPVCKQ